MARFFDRRLFQQARAERWGLALTVALGAIGGAATVGQAFALSRAVDAAFLGGLDLAGVWPWLRGLLALTALRAAAAWGAELAAGRVAARVKSALRERLLRHILALGPAYTHGERTGELVNTAGEGVEALDAYFSQYLPQVALAGLVPFIFLLFVLPADPLSGLVLLLTAPLIPLFMILIGHMADALTRRQWTELSRMSAHFLDVLQGLTTLKLFGRSREQIAVIRQITDRHRDATLRVLRVAFLSALVLEMVGTISTAIVAVEIGLRLLYGKMAFQQAFFVLILAPEFYLPLRLLGTRFHAGIAGVTAARRIFEVLEAGRDTAAPSADDALAAYQASRARPPAAGQPFTTKTQRHDGDECSVSADPWSARASPLRPRGETISPAPRRVLTRLHDVGYTYPGRDRPALAGVSLEIGPGEKVALGGPVGAGKSTVAALLLGFIRPMAGRVEFVRADDGSPTLLEERPPMAWVPQRPYLFNASVADNIRLGRPEATLEEVQRAAVAAHADAFIRALPQGYDTRIGERGNRLSAGQAQRIALARAFLLDAPLVILDEPTAHLDADTEAEVQAAIERLLEGRSALIIAHRLNTVRRVDRIVALEAGRVVPLPAPGLEIAPDSPAPWPQPTAKSPAPWPENRPTYPQLPLLAG
ncbi:MAG: thiol reductant ABC exporter subunit CydD, partial [Anaerolineae bacterium]|nr:thiol reductant ABC exporter subunit CydD [Anaerolineae bacterium]